MDHWRKYYLLLWLIGTFGKSESTGGCRDSGDVLFCSDIHTAIAAQESVKNRENELINPVRSLHISESSPDALKIILTRNLWADQLVFSELNEIRITKCHMRQIPFELLKDWSNFKILNMSDNLLEELDHMELHTRLPSVKILDLSMNNLKKINLKHEINMRIRLDCKYVIHACDSGILDMSYHDLTCGASDISISNNTCDQIRICDSCECNKFNNATRVDCNRRNLKDFPQRLPRDTKIVDLEGNQISDLSFASDDWKTVIFLNLSNNALESLDPLRTHLIILQNLRLLYLSKNRLTDIPSEVRRGLQDMDILRLGDNPWMCDCRTRDLHQWFKSYSYRINDIDDVRCADPPVSHEKNGVASGIPDSDYNFRLAKQKMIRVQPGDLCPTLVKTPEGYLKSSILDTMSGIFGGLTILIVMKLIYDWWWQKRTGKLPRFFKVNV